MIACNLRLHIIMMLMFISWLKSQLSFSSNMSVLLTTILLIIFYYQRRLLALGIDIYLLIIPT